MKIPSRTAGFTLVEVLVSAGIIVVIMVVLLAMTDQTQRLVKSTSAKVEQFQQARVAFEAMTRRLAQASLNSGKAVFGESFIYHIGQGYFYLVKSNYTTAVNSFSRGLKLNPNYTGLIPTLMFCEAKRGNRAKALAYLQTLTAKTPRTYYDKAVVFAGLSQKDSCLHNLKWAADMGHIYKDMKVVPVFRPYREEPVFQAILRQYRYP